MGKRKRERGKRREYDWGGDGELINEGEKEGGGKGKKSKQN